MNSQGHLSSAGGSDGDIDRIVLPEERPDLAKLFDHPETGAQVSISNPIKTKELKPYEQQLIESIRFRLMGYALDRSKISWKQDVKSVISVEKKLVIDPQELKETFATMRELKNQGWDSARIQQWVESNTLYGKGYHAFLNSRDGIYRVRREGIVIVAGLETSSGAFKPIAYNYTLENMPQNDEEFRLISRETLTAPAYALDDLNPESTAVAWRTGVAEYIDASILRKLGFEIPPEMEKVSLRRLGIASAEKDILIQILLARGITNVVFNIGNINDAQSKLRILNAPSYYNNTRIFGDEGLGYRSHMTHIVIKGDTDETLGMREQVATIQWYARKHSTDDAYEKLHAPDAVLASRGWDEKRLASEADTMIDQLNQERPKS